MGKSTDRLFLSPPMRSRLLVLGSIFALLGAVLLPAQAADLPPEVRIGLQDNLGPDF